MDVTQLIYQDEMAPNQVSENIMVENSLHDKLTSIIVANGANDVPNTIVQKGTDYLYTDLPYGNSHTSSQIPCIYNESNLNSNTNDNAMEIRSDENATPTLFLKGEILKYFETGVYSNTINEYAIKNNVPPIMENHFTKDQNMETEQLYNDSEPGLLEALTIATNPNIIEKMFNATLEKDQISENCFTEPEIPANLFSSQSKKECIEPHPVAAQPTSDANSFSASSPSVVTTLDLPPNKSLPDLPKNDIALIDEPLANISLWLVKNSIKTNTSLKALMKRPAVINLFKCPLKKCSYTTNDNSLFQIHLTFESFETLCCVYCLKIFKDLIKFINHVTNKHASRIFQCSRCLYRACYKFYVQVHQDMIHPKSKRLEIIECEPIKLPEDHQNVMFAPPEDNPFDPFECKLCNNMITFSKESFHIHLKEKHSNEDSFKCQYCDQSHSIEKLFSNEISCYSMRKYNCLYCNYGIDTRKDIFQHLSVFHADHIPKLYINK